MVYFCLPKYITKRARDANKAQPVWCAATLRADAPTPRVAMCLRCVQNIAKYGDACAKPELIRCTKCSDNNRAGCALVPPEFYGRVSRLLSYYDSYATAVAAALSPKKRDAAVQRTGVKLARFQKLFNSQLARYRLVSGRTGVPVALPTKAPESTPDFLALGLVEQRRMASAMERLATSVGLLVPLVQNIAQNAGRVEEEEDEEEKDDDGDGGDSSGAEGEGGNGGADDDSDN